MESYYSLLGLLALKRQLLEMFPSEETKDELLEWREGRSSGLRIERFDCVDHKLLTMPNNFTASCCQNILVPINIGPIRELDHKAVFDRSHNDRCLVHLAAAPSDVPNNRERTERGSRKPAGQGIQGVLEDDEQAITELLQLHRLSPIQNVSEKDKNGKNVFAQE
jgi:hypothetical protein